AAGSRSALTRMAPRWRLDYGLCGPQVSDAVRVRCVKHACPVPSHEVGAMVSAQRLIGRVPLARWAAPIADSPVAGTRDGGPPDAGPHDTGPLDASPRDTDPPGPRLRESGSRNAGARDAGSPHANLAETSSHGAGAPAGRRVLHWPRVSWLDLAWIGFVALNLAAMRLLPAWQTVPFLAIWVSLTVIYGFRLWRLQPTILTLAAATLATGGTISAQG